LFWILGVWCRWPASSHGSSSHFLLSLYFVVYPESSFLEFKIVSLPALPEHPEHRRLLVPIYIGRHTSHLAYLDGIQRAWTGSSHTAQPCFLMPLYASQPPLRRKPSLPSSGRSRSRRRLGLYPNPASAGSRPHQFGARISTSGSTADAGFQDSSTRSAVLGSDNTALSGCCMTELFPCWGISPQSVFHGIFPSSHCHTTYLTEHDSSYHSAEEPHPTIPLSTSTHNT
jgi:hypothetical protein